MRRGGEAALALIPVAAIAASAGATAWLHDGSILAEDWLLYALLAGLVLATVLVAGAAIRPPRALSLGLTMFTALALWAGLSATWSPVPSLARDEALLILFYAAALAVPVMTLRSELDRRVAISMVVAASAATVVATSIRLATAEDVAELYWSKRLASPIGYPGADAALFLVSFWPAAAFAASPRLNVILRVLAFAASVAVLAGALMTQSRAASVALAVSAVAVVALAPTRLRLLVPVFLAVALTSAAYGPLTEPYGADAAAFEEAIRAAGRWTLALVLIGQGVGIVYVLVDRRFALRRDLVRAAGVAATAAALVAAGVGITAFFVSVDAPRQYVAERWEDFKHQPEREPGRTHLTTLGTSRYDFWRVALDQFRDHPVEGEGARSFATRYARDGRTIETPRHSHSVELDLLGETGLVGFGLFAAALAPFGRRIGRRARSDLLAAGVLGAATFWLAQASVDWIWTAPAVGLPFFLLLGAGAARARSDPERLAPRAAVGAGVAVGAAALILFAPPWLSARYTASALAQQSGAARDELRWARRLDPLSIAPLIAEAELATSPREALPPLEKAVEREPRSSGPRYALGLAYLKAGRVGEARRELRRARELAPRSPWVAQALQRADQAARR